MAVNDIYQITLGQNLGSNTRQLNVFYYRQTDTDASSFQPSANLLTGFNLGFMGVGGDLPAVLSENVEFTDIEVINLFNPVDFTTFIYNPSQQGERVGDRLPNTNCWGFRSNRATRAIRRGQKRFGGLAESDVNGNLATGGIGTLLDNLADQLGQVVANTTQPDSANFLPCVVKRIKETNPETGRVSYRLPESQAEAESFDAIQWEYVKVTTQNTRKLGRGI